MQEYNPNTLTLTDVIVSNIITALDTELNLLGDPAIARVSSQTQEVYQQIIQFLTGHALDKRKYTMFVTATLVETSEQIFNDVNVRDLLFNVSDRALFLLETKGIDYQDVVLPGILKAISRPRVCDDANLSLVPYQILNTIRTEEASIEKLLKNNPWLTVFYVIKFFFSESAHFKALVLKNGKH